jgi:hypothetical protein
VSRGFALEDFSFIVGGYMFKTKKEAGEYCRELLASWPLGKPFHEPFSTLIMLCNDCHKKAHRKDLGAM